MGHANLCLRLRRCKFEDHCKQDWVKRAWCCQGWLYTLQGRWLGHLQHSNYADILIRFKVKISGDLCLQKDDWLYNHQIQALEVIYYRVGPTRGMYQEATCLDVQKSPIGNNACCCHGGMSAALEIEGQTTKIPIVRLNIDGAWRMCGVHWGGFQ